MSNNKDWTGGYQSIVGCLGASNHSKEEREENDFYATDPKAAEYLMELEELNKNIWECACGEGHLSKPMLEKGYNVKSTDLIDRKFGKGGGRFPGTDRCFRWRYCNKPTLQIC